MSLLTLEKKNIHIPFLFLTPRYLPGEVLFLMWGVKVCFSVRKAESFFDEATYISWAVYNIAVVNIVMVTFQ